MERLETCFIAIVTLVLFAIIVDAHADNAADHSASANGNVESAQPAHHHRAHRRHIDHSGNVKKGKASFYSHKAAGDTMANGKPLDPASNAAASKTLPIGTTAKVTNLKNGKSAVVKIQDRGPYVEGRIVDVTPKTAKELGMVKSGVAPVEVTPIEVPQADGSTKRSEAAEENK